MNKERKESKRQGRRSRSGDSERQQPHFTNYPEPRLEAEVFADLTSLCASTGYIHALSYVIFRDGVVTAGEEFKKEDFQKLYNRERLIRTEITALIGLWLHGTRSLTLPDALAVQNMIDRTDKLMAELHAAMLAPAHQDFVAAIKARQADPDVESPLGKAAAMREAIFYSGESAFTFQYSDFARQRYAADTEWLQKNYGFDIGTAADFFEKLISYLSEQMPIRFGNLRQLPMSEWTMLPIFCFTEAEAIEVTGFSVGTVRKVITAFSVPPNSKNDRYTGLFSFNEAAVLPFVTLEDGRIAFLQEYVGTEALYNSPAYWMRTDANHAATASKHRGEFAEALSFKLIERVFPQGRIYRNILFKASKNVTAGEADLVLVQGKRAFVFQLKSKGLTELARTGNELAVTRDFSAAIQRAYVQAVSCIDLLRSGVPTYKDGKPFSIPHIDAVEEFYPICITSENYPALSFQVGQFLKRSEEPWVKAPIIMDLFTLDAITEFLRSPLYMIDYFAKRSLLFEKVLSSHELVLLAYHLRGNLFVPEDVTMLFVEDDFMIELDLAMAVRRRGLPGSDTPSGILTRDLNNPLGRILTGADKTDRPDVHQMGELILNLSSTAWDNINRWVSGLAAQARRDHKNHDVTVPLEEGGAGLTIHCNDLQQSEAFKKLVSHCEIRKYIHKTDRWFGVCLSPEDEDVRFAVGRVGPWKFTPELEDEAAKLKVRSASHWMDGSGRKTKLGRNDPCPCGSGKKYKKCHLN